jgi:hypothetical protein
MLPSLLVIGDIKLHAGHLPLTEDSRPSCRSSTPCQTPVSILMKAARAATGTSSSPLPPSLGSLAMLTPAFSTPHLSAHLLSWTVVGSLLTKRHYAGT